MGNTEICLVCSNKLEPSHLKQECKCNICQDCLYEWIKQKNEETLHVETDFFSCPNANCKKELQKEWIYSNLPKDKIAVLDELLLKKYLNKSTDIKKCPKENCKFSGFLDSSQTYCNKPLVCGLCDQSWIDKSLLCNHPFRNVFESLKHTKLNFLDEFTELRIHMFTKPCFHCKRNTYKFTGCNHMTCSCKKEFCYSCLGDYATHNDDKFCRYKLDYKGTFTLLMMLLFMLKTLLSFYYIKLFLHYLSFFLLINILAIGVIILFYFAGMIWGNIRSKQGLVSNILSKLIPITGIVSITTIIYLYFTNDSVNFSIKIIMAESFIVGICASVAYIYKCYRRIRNRHV